MTELEAILLKRIKALEAKLDAIQFYFEHEEILEAQLTHVAGLCYIPDDNLMNVITALQKHNPV